MAPRMKKRHCAPACCSGHQEERKCNTASDIEQRSTAFRKRALQIIEDMKKTSEADTIAAFIAEVSDALGCKHHSLAPSFICELITRRP
jgi:hypothetical protein